MTSWTPTRDAAFRRLEHFVPRAGRAYAKLRNYDRGPGRHDDVSTLSPWIRHRLILEEEVIAAVLRRHSFSAADKFIQEVFWRTYWKGWLERRPSVWHDHRGQVRELVDRLDRDAGLRGRWEEAAEGRTGIECFDAWSRELIETGYLHNHVRMWFASIWIFTLELPWELGADFFLRHLLDGDPASNTLSWRWVAGLQTRGKTYLARPDNIAKYTDGRFKAATGLASNAVPLEGPPAPPTIAVPVTTDWDHTLSTGLLVTEDDLDPLSLFDDELPFRCAAVMSATDRRSPLGVGPLVRGFVQGAIDDTRDRLVSKSCIVGEPTDTVASVEDWARGEGLRQIVTAHTPVGPTAEALGELRTALAEHDIAVIPVLRDFDQAAWQHATRGFFPFREKIPSILAKLGASTTLAT